MLVKTKEILLDAKREKYAIPAFNYSNLEVLKAIIEGAEEMNAPVIAESAEEECNYVGFETLTHMSLEAIKKSKAPIALHWDHGFDPDRAIKAAQNGWSSVMIDSSSLDFEQNVKNSKRVVEESRKHNCAVEAEIGHVSGDSEGIKTNSSIYTDPKEAEEFYKQTGVDFLAISVGTIHGDYKGKIELQIDTIKEIANKIPNVPLVLHGSSGTPEDQLKSAINAGITKINVGTDLKKALLQSSKKWIEENPNSTDIIDFNQYSISEIKKIVIEKIKLFGCQGKGSKYTSK